MIMASSILMCDPVYETIFPTLLPSFRSKSLPGFSLRPAAENHSHAVSKSSSFLYHLSVVNKVFLYQPSIINKVSLALFVQPAGHSGNTDHGHGLFGHLRQDFPSPHIANADTIK